MQHTHWLAPFSALGLGFMTVTAQAAPLANTTMLGPGAPFVEKVAAQCWWRNGVRRCSYGYRARQPVYGFPQYYRTGSNRWWEEMDRDRRGGRR
jgi:hypothetical protein